MPARPLLHRRAVLGAGAAAVLATACDTGEDLTAPEASGSATASPDPTAATDRAADQTPDQALVEEVTTALVAALAVLERARRVAGVRPVVRPLVQAHRAHQEVLVEDQPVVERGPVPPDAATALQQVRRSERRLQEVLVAGAGRAESGALARLLASMSASVTQHLLVLASEPVA